MTIRNLKCTGWILVVAGVVGVGITVVGISAIETEETGQSATALAEAISGTLVPATIGALLALVGLILLLSAWWRRRQADSSTGPSGA